jgi:hypothetical protein
MASVDTESSMVPGEFFSGKFKLVRRALLGGRSLKLPGPTRREDPGREIAGFNRRRLDTVVVGPRDYCH